MNCDELPAARKLWHDGRKRSSREDDIRRNSVNGESNTARHIIQRQRKKTTDSKWKDINATVEEDNYSEDDNNEGVDFARNVERGAELQGIEGRISEVASSSAKSPNFYNTPKVMSRGNHLNGTRGGIRSQLCSKVCSKSLYDDRRQDETPTVDDDNATTALPPFSPSGVASLPSPASSDHMPAKRKIPVDKCDGRPAKKKCWHNLCSVADCTMLPTREASALRMVRRLKNAAKEDGRTFP